MTRVSLPGVPKKTLDLTYRGQVLAQYQLDLVVENQILLELKAVESLHPKHVSQLIQYLAMTGLKLGILINFGRLDGLEYRRVVHERASESR